MNMFENIDVCNEQFLEACKELFPGFEEKVGAKLKEQQNAELLQKQANLTEDIENLKSKLAKLEAELTEVHKQWIALNPVQSTTTVANAKKQLSPVRKAFDLLWSEYATVNDCYDTTFKRFDNLVHGRCKRCVMFEQYVDFGMVVEELHNQDEDGLAEELANINSKLDKLADVQ